MQLPKWIHAIIDTIFEEESNDTIDKEFYYKLLDLNCDAIAFYSDKAGCIGVNKHFLSLFNLSSIDEYSKKYKTFYSLFSDEDEVLDTKNDTTWLNHIQQVYPNGYGVRFLDENSNIQHFQIFVKSLEHNEEELYYITLKEAKELHEIQSRLIENEKIKKEFLSKIGMQFRTPMQGILGFVKMLEQTALDNTQKAYLSQVSIAAQEMTLNIETLLDSAESEVTSTSINIGVLHPFIEVDAIINSFAQKAKEYQVKIYSDIDPALPKMLDIDTKKIKQLLVHILNYSLEISHKEANIIFSMHKKELDVSNDFKLECSISISNTIADPRRDDLSVIRKLINILGDNLEIMCEDDGFASLNFSIKTKSTNKKEISLVKEKKVYHILVVEDNFMNQNLLSLILQEYGLDVSVASNGQEAVDKAKENRFDLILMDINMPVKNGIVATQEIKQNQPKNSPFLPIVAVTALAMQGDRERLLKAGLDDYISKPISRELLIYVLNKYLDIGV